MALPKPYDPFTPGYLPSSTSKEGEGGRGMDHRKAPKSRNLALPVFFYFSSHYRIFLKKGGHSFFSTCCAKNTVLKPQLFHLSQKKNKKSITTPLRNCSALSKSSPSLPTQIPAASANHSTEPTGHLLESHSVTLRQGIPPIYSTKSPREMANQF